MNLSKLFELPEGFIDGKAINIKASDVINAASGFLYDISGADLLVRIFRHDTVTGDKTYSYYAVKDNIIMHTGAFHDTDKFVLDIEDKELPDLPDGLSDQKIKKATRYFRRINPDVSAIYDSEYGHDKWCAHGTIKKGFNVYKRKS